MNYGRRVTTLGDNIVTVLGVIFLFLVAFGVFESAWFVVGTLRDFFR